MVFRDVLQPEEAQILRSQFKNGTYQERRQGRKIGVKAGPDLPDSEEIYTAEFLRSGSVDLGKVEKRIRAVMQVDGPMDLRAHKLVRGGHFRCHTDERVGQVGFTLTLSKGWKWDWGGLLMVMDGDRPTPYLPRFNELVVIQGQPHWVTEVSKWALEPRYTLVGFV